MPTFSGKFQYQNADGSAAQAGSCRVTIEEETFTLTPASGAPLAFDLGDVDVLLPGDYDLALTLYTGKKILLQQFGKAFQNLSHDLLEAYRQRLVRCLLLEDLEEIARWDGQARLESPRRSFASLAEFRLYQSNLAVLPTQATGLQWRLADIDTLSFDEASYTVTLRAADERLLVTKLAKRTREFVERVQEAGAQLTEKCAQTLHGLFPFLNPDQLQQVTQLMREGHAAPLAKLQVIHPKTPQALAMNVVDTPLKPYYDALLRHVPEGCMYAGFKLLRKDAGEDADQEETPAGEAEAAAAADAAAETVQAPEPEPAAADEQKNAEQPILHWFFFPLAKQPGAKTPANLVAWEATSQSGRATYFFRLVPPNEAGQLADTTQAPALVESAVRQLNHAIVLLNFRREPIYLPDDSLQIEPRFHRYAIAARKIPELARLRASFLGRAIHTSLASWQKQLEGFLAKA
jgi:hypothetical protein